MTIRLDSYLVRFVSFFSFFPWVKFDLLNFGSDIQIYPTLLCILSLPIILILRIYRGNGLVFNRDRLSDGIIIFISGCFFSISAILIIDGLTFDALRSIFPYFSAIAWLSFVSLSARYYSEDIKKIVPYVFVLWVFVGLVQLFIDREFLVFLMNRTVITHDRGVIALGSEPAYFAMVLLSMLFFFYVEQRRIFALLSLCCLLFLSKSSAVILPLVLSIALLWGGPIARSSTKSNLNFILLLVLIFLFVMFISLIQLIYDEGVLDNIGESSRIAKVFQMFAELDFSSLILDSSFNIRLTHYAGSFSAFFGDFFIPHGTEYWTDFITRFSQNSTMFWDAGLRQTTRINSGLGTVLFEGGIFGLMIFLGVYMMLTAYENSLMRKILIFLVIFIFFMTVFSIKIPFIYIIAMLYCNKKRCDSEISKQTSH